MVVFLAQVGVRGLHFLGIVVLDILLLFFYYWCFENKGIDLSRFKSHNIKFNCVTCILLLEQPHSEIQQHSAGQLQVVGVVVGVGLDGIGHFLVDDEVVEVVGE